jgi:hypothetical protein
MMADVQPRRVRPLDMPNTRETICKRVEPLERSANLTVLYTLSDLEFELGASERSSGRGPVTLTVASRLLVSASWSRQALW